MQGIVDSHPKITTNRFSYNRLSTAEVRPSTNCQKRLARRGIAQDRNHPHAAQSIELLPQQGRENETSKKIALTDAIFDQMAVVNAAALDDPTILRLSLDAIRPINDLERSPSSGETRHSNLSN
jgi:hypothetical protein